MAKDRCWAVVLPIFCSDAVPTKILSQTGEENTQKLNSGYEFVFISFPCIQVPLNESSALAVNKAK